MQTAQVTLSSLLEITTQSCGRSSCRMADRQRWELFPQPRTSNHRAIHRKGGFGFPRGIPDGMNRLQFLGRGRRYLTALSMISFEPAHTQREKRARLSPGLPCSASCVYTVHMANPAWHTHELLVTILFDRCRDRIPNPTYFTGGSFGVP